MLIFSANFCTFSWLLVKSVPLPKLYLPTSEFLKELTVSVLSERPVEGNADIEYLTPSVDSV